MKKVISMILSGAAVFIQPYVYGQSFMDALNNLKKATENLQGQNKINAPVSAGSNDSKSQPVNQNATGSQQGQPGKISSATTAQLNKPYPLFFTLKNNPGRQACGLRIDWGDGSVENIGVGVGQKLPPPYSPVNHTYSKEGKYRIRVSGESMMLAPSPQMQPMPSSPCAIWDELTVAVESADVNQQTSIDKINDKFTSVSFRHNYAWTWGKKDGFGDNSRTMSRCLALDASKREVLYGNEISFRPPVLDSTGEACGTWLDVSTSLIRSEDLSGISQKEDGLNQKRIAGKYLKDNNIDAILLKLDVDTYAGWYGVRGRQFFSEGIFVSPLVSKPIEGVFDYFGDMTINRKAVVEIKKFQLDFKEGTISIAGTYDVTGESYRVFTRNPIKFDLNSGYFAGEISTLQMTGASNSNGRMLISGTVGGVGGRVVAATMHDGNVLFKEGTGGRETRGFDFMIFQRK